MELRHLRYFLAVADTGNLTRAAKKCYVAQSALSAQLARLEAELGGELFLRGRRGMTLTAAGEALHPLASRLLADAAALEAHMASLRDVISGRLRLGVIQGAPAHLDIVTLVASFHRSHPGVQLDVRTGASETLAADVRDGRLDLAIVALPAADVAAIAPELAVTPLEDDPLVAVLPGGAAVSNRARRISATQLLTYGPFIHYRRGTGLRRSVTATFDRSGIEITSPFELDQISDMVRLAVAGVGVTIVPASALQQPNFAGVTGVALTDPDAVHTISAVTPTPPSRAASVFLHLTTRGQANTLTELQDH